MSTTNHEWDAFSVVDQDLGFGNATDPDLVVRCQIRSFAPTERSARITGSMHFRFLLQAHDIDWRASADPWGDMQDVREMEE